MISSEVQRTLVKSTPELWSELSDPTALARHLGELGEIRITRVEPERTVEWEAEKTTGTVKIKPSGWGTRVTLTVNRELPEPPPDSEPMQEQDAPEAGAEEPLLAPEPFLAPILAVEPELPPWMVAEPALDWEPEGDPELAPAWSAADQTEPEPEPESMPRRGFFARLFGWRRERSLERTEQDTDSLASDPDTELEAEWDFEPDPEFASDYELAPELEQSHDLAPAEPAAEPEPVPSEQPPDISAELKAAEEAAAEEVTAVLTSVLDRLGAAHHRPFSRA
jgi:hypothetical protein